MRRLSEDEDYLDGTDEFDEIDATFPDGMTVSELVGDGSFRYPVHYDQEMIGHRLTTEDHQILSARLSM